MLAVPLPSGFSFFAGGKCDDVEAPEACWYCCWWDEVVVELPVFFCSGRRGLLNRFVIKEDRSMHNLLYLASSLGSLESIPFQRCNY